MKATPNTIHAIGVGSDFSVQGGGGDSVFILRAHSEECQLWLDEHVEDTAQRFGGGIAVEHRYIQNLVFALESEGFTGRSI